MTMNMITTIRNFWSNRSVTQRTMLIYAFVLLLLYHAMYFQAIVSSNGCVPDVVGCHKPLEFYVLLVFVLLGLSLYDIDLVFFDHAEIDNLFAQNILLDCFVLWLISIPAFLLVRLVYRKIKGGR
jgi:hypothetical protein